MIQVSKRVERLSESATLVMSRLSGELRAKGVDVINMSLGEPDFNTPEHIKEAAKRAVDENFSHYSPAGGYLSLRRAICRKLREENGLDYEPGQVVVGNGAKQELCNVVLACVNEGDEVIIPVPAWVSYVEMVKLAGGVPVLLHTGVESDFKISAQQLEEAITERTRLFMFNSPSNPTGVVYSDTELAELTGVLARHEDVLVMSDEIYEHINFGVRARSIASFEGMAGRTAVVNGVSKAYAMTGWRIGYVAGPDVIIRAVNKLQGQYTSGVSSISQKAAEAAYEGGLECVERMCAAFERRRDLIVELAGDMPGWRINRPQGAFYLFPEIEGCIGKRTPVGKVIGSDEDYVMYLLEDAHVACVAGSAFCAPGYMRLSYAADEEDIREAMRRIRRATEALR